LLGNAALLPSQLLTLKESLTVENSLWDYQLYVMTVLSVKLFLRQDELLDLCVESFRGDLFDLTEDGFPNGLAVKVQVSVFVLLAVVQTVNVTNEMRKL
jgi:hypothetical protein